ncbi:hypothetical protein CDD83_9536 [Cordyceps sp. RAO-2017]|nr:hypothetical protein CDD83_9536 [Cordyceps sp. RAO-2017]
MASVRGADNLTCAGAAAVRGDLLANRKSATAMPLGFAQSSGRVGGSVHVPGCYPCRHVRHEYSTVSTEADRQHVLAGQLESLPHGGGASLPSDTASRPAPQCRAARTDMMFPVSPAAGPAAGSPARSLLTDKLETDEVCETRGLKECRRTGV